jgi:hypothetical protein
MALRMVAVAMVWHVSILTKNTLAVGILGLSEVIPAIGFALYAGHVVDISDKRKLLNVQEFMKQLHGEIWINLFF